MLSLREKVGYGLGDMASSMFWKLFGAYLLIFYTDVFGLPAAVVGTIFMITRIWDSFLDPIVGIIADRTNSRWGKFRPYIFSLAIPFALAGILTFFTPPFGESGKIVYAYISYSLMMIVYSFINVPYASLLGVISPEPTDRNILSSFRMTFAYIGSFVTLLLFLPLVNQFSEKSNPESAWTAAVSVISIVCAILFIFCFFLTKERVQPISVKSDFKSDIADLMHNKPWWILSIAGVFSLIFNSIRDGATVYYFKYYIVESDYEGVTLFNMPLVLSGIYLACGQASNIIGVILSSVASNRIGKKNTFIIAMSIATVLSVIFFWAGKENLWMVFTLQVLISICAGSVFPILWSMYADCADYSELKTGKRSTGLIFSSSSMSQKIGWAIGGALTGWLLAFFGFEANMVQSEDSIQGIKFFMSFIPAIGSLLSLICISMYSLDERSMKRIIAALKVKRKTLIG